MNICSQCISRKENNIADKLFQVIFHNINSLFDHFVNKLTKKVFLNQNVNECFEKLWKKSYRDMLIQLTTENQAIHIQKYKQKLFQHCA